MQRIKDLAKKKNILIKTMLNDCGLSINTLSQISDKKGVSSFSLAKMADYLDCSVDYLLGRTDEPKSESMIELEPDELPVIAKYRAIGEINKKFIDDLLDECYKNRNAPTADSDERIFINAILQSRKDLQPLVDQLVKMDSEKLTQVIRLAQDLKSSKD